MGELCSYVYDPDWVSIKVQYAEKALTVVPKLLRLAELVNCESRRW